MHANPFLRSLQLTAIDARAARPASPPGDSPTPAPDRPALAAVADLPLGTPLDDLCETVELRCPNRDRGRVHLRKLLGDLGWAPDPGTELAVVVAADRPVLWVDGAAPAQPVEQCTCSRCDHDHTPPAERLLAAGHRLPEPATVDDQHRLRLTAGGTWPPSRRPTPSRWWSRACSTSACSP